MKEQVAEIIDKALMADMVDGRLGSKPYAQEVINLFKSQLDKLTVKDEGELVKIFMYPSEDPHICYMLKPYKKHPDMPSFTVMSIAKQSAKAQLQHTKKQLLESMEE